MVPRTDREAIRQVDPTIPLYAIGTMEEAIGESVDTQRRYMALVTVFAGIAVLLAAIGLYGVIAFSVRQRVREIGVRVALGAARRDVIWLILSRALAVCLAGVGLGVAGALGASSLLASLLFEIEPRDVLTYAVVAGLLMVVGLLASYVPARRATRVDPMVAFDTNNVHFSTRGCGYARTTPVVPLAVTANGWQAVALWLH
jgi:putative ABC transport system permease protein